MNEMHKPVSRRFGLTAFAGGVMLVVFGFRMDLVWAGFSVGLILVTLAAAIFSFAKHEPGAILTFAIVGLLLAAIMVLVHYLFGIDGFVGALLRPYEQF